MTLLEQKNLEEKHAALIAFLRGLQPDPALSVQAWSDKYMIIPASTGSNESGPYRTSRTPHAREVMRCLSDDHPAKRVVVMGASQMLKTQVGLNWLMSTIHQSPSNFLWLVPTGKLHKRAASRIDKTIAAIPQIEITGTVWNILLRAPNASPVTVGFNFVLFQNFNRCHKFCFFLIAPMFFQNIFGRKNTRLAVESHFFGKLFDFIPCGI